jgi:hypothetical protein
MESQYLKAMETRLNWLRWAKTHGYDAWNHMENTREQNNGPRIGSRPWRDVLPNYEMVLESGDTFFMNRQFCAMVEQARLTVPDDLVFEHSWMQSSQGWLWIETPFQVPQPAGITETDADGTPIAHVGAVGWYPIPQGTKLGNNRIATEGSYNILTFQNFQQYSPHTEGFGCWSYFTLIDGDKLIDRIRLFEAKAAADLVEPGAYPVSRESDVMHEIRWVYAAFFLMSQRLAMTVQHKTDRHHRRRAERLELPVPPFLKVITLRRYEQERERDALARLTSPNTVDWNWQWLVGAHWRNQYYPASGEHRWKYIYDYIKGPEDKPLKPIGHKIFIAKR